MIYITLEPHQADPFQNAIKTAEWDLISQEGGQSQFIGWAYIMHWQKNIDGKVAEVWLHYSDNQGKLEAYLEMNPVAKPEVSALVESL